MVLCPAFTFAATRLFPAKPLGCYGDRRAIFFHDPADLEPLQSFCVDGEGTDRYDNVRIGVNGCMDMLQVAILLRKLHLFDDEIALRGAVADRYAAGFRDAVAVPGTPAVSVSTWAQYTIRVPAARRAEIADALRARRPDRHLQSPAAAQADQIEGFPNLCNELPVCKRLVGEVPSLPTHPYLAPADQDRVIQAVRDALAA